MDNLAMFIAPTKGGDVQVGYGMLPAVDPELPNLDLLLKFVPLWDNTFVPHFVSIQDYERDCDTMVGTNKLGEHAPAEGTPPWYAKHEITHVALIEGPCIPQGSDAFLFGNETIKGISAVMWYSDTRKKYRLLHCEDCCSLIMAWLSEMQETWDASIGSQESGPKAH